MTSAPMFPNSLDPIDRLTTYETQPPLSDPQAPEKVPRAPGLSAAITRWQASTGLAFGGVCAAIAGLGLPRPIEVRELPQHPATPAPRRHQTLSEGQERAIGRRLEQIAHQAELYADTPEPPETRQQRRARERAERK